MMRMGRKENRHLWPAAPSDGEPADSNSSGPAGGLGDQLANLRTHSVDVDSFRSTPATFLR
jgi:hypothetical protein